MILEFSTNYKTANGYAKGVIGSIKNSFIIEEVMMLMNFI